MRLKDSELQKAVCYKLGKFGNQDLEENDFQKVEEVNINNRKFSGEEKNVSLEELRLFPNLKRISLQYFTLDDICTSILNDLPNLESLELASCNLESRNELAAKNLDYLALNCCRIKDYGKIVSPKRLTVTGDEHFRLDRISGKECVEAIIFQCSTVNGFGSIRECSSLKKLNLEETKVDDKTALEEMRRRIAVVELDKYEPIR